MGELDGFELLEKVSGIPSVAITKNGVSFNKSTLEKLRCPDYVQLLIDRTNKRIALKPCKKEDNGSRQFYRKDKDISKGVRWNNYDIRATLGRLCGWDLEAEGWKVSGVYYADENALIFDLNDAERLTHRR